ncbi:hypothetical protein NDK47_16300 [Brevibacillus ruminantium]|uniref:DUF1080 domain-containing protein n=1 Tax=Brevibacillus ruminantium TaxID=2950604 RepID=A0ABY4W988_9BACL|nr:hypothetical protein [Brevibacillus ruminantium]USG63733.1 hypothetical protein NDK47_16300 [Brevibacillus ruminantium]
MTADKQMYSLWDDLERFDLGDSEAIPSEWNDKKALYLEKMNSAVFLRDEVKYNYFRLQAEVAIPGEVGFIGLVFGAKDPGNYELVYLAPVEIQYDPVVNGSMTWQIYHGPSYQKPLPDMTGAWHKFSLEVQPGGARVFLGENKEPALVLTRLQHGGQRLGRVGVWSFLPSYIRNLVIEEIPQAPIEPEATDLRKLKSESFITEWRVSSSLIQDGAKDQTWTKAFVEENGTLNINRIHRAKPGATVEVKSDFAIEEEEETVLSLGYSDSIRLWVNGKEVYQGDWCWSPPYHDGRIRPDFASVPIKWRKGANSIRAELSQRESFGWGLAVKTGLSKMTFINDNDDNAW